MCGSVNDKDISESIVRSRSPFRHVDYRCLKLYAEALIDMLYLICDVLGMAVEEGVDAGCESIGKFVR